MVFFVRKNIDIHDHDRVITSSVFIIKSSLMKSEIKIFHHSECSDEYFLIKTSISYIFLYKGLECILLYHYAFLLYKDIKIVQNATNTSN